MNANPILLQRKYARVVELFANENQLPLDVALDFFYHSSLYQLMREGSSDIHCMSDQYLSQDLTEEWAAGGGDSFFVLKRERKKSTSKKSTLNEQGNSRKDRPCVYQTHSAARGIR